MGFYPTVIGGWAVYYHTEYQKSQDIDIVMPDEESFYKFFEFDFFRKRGYDDQQKGTDYQHYGKPTTDSNSNPATIHLDVMYGDRSRIIRGLNIRKDYSWVLDNRDEVEFEGNKMYIPVIELLLTLKIIAALERGYDLKYEDNLEIRAQYESKIKKDYLDVASLIKVFTAGNPNKKLNQNKLKEFFIKSKVNEHIKRFVSVYEAMYPDILQTVVPMNKIKENLL